MSIFAQVSIGLPPYARSDCLWIYQRSTTAVSVASTTTSAVAPVRYAHLAAAQFSQFMKFDDLSEISSSPGGQTSSGHAHVSALPKLHENHLDLELCCVKDENVA
ncbi:hypothetical protein WN943_005030 [Citrus x changshan-huyou]